MPDVDHKPSVMQRRVRHLSAITDAAKQTWRKGVVSDDLRQALFSTPRLEAKIVAEIVGHSYSDVAEAEVAPDQENLLDFLLTADLGKIILRSGLIWFSHNFLAPQSVRELLAQSSRVETADVRFALALRRHGSGEPFETADNEAETIASGRQCVSAWVRDLPEYLRAPLAVFDHPVGALYREDTTVSAARAKTCAVCLEHLGAEK